MEDILYSAFGGLGLFIVYFIHFILTHDKNEQKKGVKSDRNIN